MKQISILVSVVFLLFSCSKKNPTDSGVTPDGEFKKTGKVNERVISVNPNSTVSESSTGLTFLFPEGGAGTLKTAPIVSEVTTAPVPGNGYYINYDQTSKISLVFDTTDGSTFLVYGFGTTFGLLSDYSMRDQSWVSLPPRALSNREVAFDLIICDFFKRCLHFIGKKVIDQFFMWGQSIKRCMRFYPVVVVDESYQFILAMS